MIGRAHDDPSRPPLEPYISAVRLLRAFPRNIPQPERAQGGVVWRGNSGNVSTVKGFMSNFPFQQKE